MPDERLLTILEEIRDQQKMQIANFERALATQDEAMALHRRAKQIFFFLVFMPWLLVAGLGIMLLITTHTLG
jgi:hypothetical protein